ncbi:MAG TPA: hypothetical protein IAB31_03505 [Candidatus Choladousia intestinavium]|uniref:Uncharacterized protein n=1 Tax=Candidatus Choladousia intestinavium TaxID=2840727 RepID=A0A9D1D9T6_9FIRM|nr:hypothetical protein [Candidatus Choladousia intestinavium]
MKNTKQWIAAFFIILAVGIGIFMATNFFVDPTGYFSVERGADEVDANGYTRAAKSKYIKKHADEYDAVVLGGSKSGVLSTELLSEYTGKNYYNFYFAYGCFADFLTYTQYLIETAGVEEITLHLSSIEVQKYNREDTNEIYEVPAVVNGNSLDKALETLNYLCRNITSSIEYLMEGQDELEKGMDSLITGERNYSYPYSLMEEDWDAYVDEYVLPRYQQNLRPLFERDPSVPAIEQNIEAMRQIKEICDENGVTLKVVIGPTFLAEIYKFEGEAYYDYLRELVKITDIWDFSGFIPENLNPYNFVNEGHYNNTVADLIVNIMYGKAEREGFGVVLTQDNIEEYLAERKADYERLKAEYEETGTVALYGLEDESYIADSGIQ